MDVEAVTTAWSDLQLWWDKVLLNSDKRVANWGLMSSYTPTWILTFIYLFVVYYGQRVMKNRPAFDLRWTLVLYNVGLVALNFHICSELLLGAIRERYNWLCQPIDYSLSNLGETRIARALWWYYISKVVEFLDTVFFVLRKKNNQISFLHVYHHATMFPLWWIGVKWVAGGQSFFGAMINSFIHVIMYSYYAIAGLGPEYQKYLWWKRYLTKLQLLQFFVGMLYGLYSFYVDCRAVPRWMEFAGMFYGFTMIALFFNFYVKEYITRVNRRKLTNGSTPVPKGHTNGHSNGHGHSIGQDASLKLSEKKTR